MIHTNIRMLIDLCLMPYASCDTLDADVSVCDCNANKQNSNSAARTQHKERTKYNSRSTQIIDKHHIENER